MDRATKRVSEYIRQKGFNLSEISRKTELPYMVLYDSLMNEKRNRDLRVDEFLRLCDHLDVDPMQFYAFESNVQENESIPRVNLTPSKITDEYVECDVRLVAGHKTR